MMSEESERIVRDMEVKLFNAKFDRLTADEASYGDVIEMLTMAMHSKPVQDIITDKYLEYKGYNVDEVEERGKKFLKEALEKAKCSESEGS